MSLDSHLDLVTELLACQTERRSCTVVVAAEGVETRLHFEEGTLVYAEEGTAGQALGRLLVGEGKLSEEQYGKLLDALAEAGLRGSTARLGDLAVKRGYLTRKDLGLSLFAQVRRKVVQAIVWEEPSVRVLPPEVESGSARARFPTTLEPLVLSAFRKVSREALERRIAPFAHGNVTLEGDLEPGISAFRAKPEERAALEARLASASGMDVSAASGEGLAFLAALVATRHLVALAGPPSQRKKVIVKFPHPPAAAGFPRLSRAAKKQLLAKVARQKVSADESGMMPAVGLEPEPGTPAAKLRAERAFQEGKAHLAKGRETLAKAEFWRAHRLVPTVAEYELYLGWLTTKGDEKRAAELESLALRAKRQDPELGFASYVLSHLALLRGDVERAEAEQQRAARLGVRGSTLPPSLGLAQVPFRLDSAAFAAPRTTVSIAGRTLPFRDGKRRKAAPIETAAEVVPHPMDAGWDDVLGPKSAAALPAGTGLHAEDPPANAPAEPQPRIDAPKSERTPLSDAPPPVPAVESDVFEEAAPFSFLLPKVSKSSHKLEAVAPVAEDATNASESASTATEAQARGEASAAEKARESSTSEVAPSVRTVTSTEGSNDASSAEAPKDVVEKGSARVESAPASIKSSLPSEPRETAPSSNEAKAPSEAAEKAPRSTRSTTERATTEKPATSKKRDKKPAARATTESEAHEGNEVDEVDEVAPVSEPVPLPPGSTGRGPLFVGVGLGLVLVLVGWFYVRDTTPVRPEPPPPVTTASVSATTTTTSVSDAGANEAGASLEDAETRDVAAQNADASANEDAARPTDAAAPSADVDAAPPNPHGKHTGEIDAEDAPRGRRVFVDGRAVGETPAIVTAPCGTHEVKVGSKGTPQTVDIPCGGRVTVRP